MTDMVHVRKSSKAQVSLAEIQNMLDAREEATEVRGVVSTKKARIEQAKRDFNIDPLATVEEISDLTNELCMKFDEEIGLDSVPLRQSEINTLSDEWLLIERIKAHIEALETRYRALTFAHLDEVNPRVPGRPAAQVPGKMAATGDGPRVVFERRGGNRKDPDLDAEGLRKELPAHVAAKIYKTVVHPAVEAYEEEVFDEAEFFKAVEEGEIDLDTIAPYLTPGEWRKPSHYKTIVGE